VGWRRFRERFGGVRRTLAHGFYVDEAYGRGLVLPAKAVSSFAASTFDARLIDGAVDGLGRAFARLAASGRRVQSGLVRTYALAFLLGAVALVLVLLVRSS
jgi:NADH-quinone oxidoreductase subunit L